MKRKLIFAGALAVVVLALFVLIAGRNGWNQNSRNDYSRAVLTSDGQLTFPPGDHVKMTVVVDQRKTGATSSPPASSPSR